MIIVIVSSDYNNLPHSYIFIYLLVIIIIITYSLSLCPQIISSRGMVIIGENTCG